MLSSLLLTLKESALKKSHFQELYSCIETHSLEQVLLTNTKLRGSNPTFTGYLNPFLWRCLTPSCCVCCQYLARCDGWTRDQSLDLVCLENFILLPYRGQVVDLKLFKWEQTLDQTVKVTSITTTTITHSQNEIWILIKWRHKGCATSNLWIVTYFNEDM